MPNNGRRRGAQWKDRRKIINGHLVEAEDRSPLARVALSLGSLAELPRSDTIAGWAGNDDCYGGSGDDEVRCGAGNDRIDGGFGFDELFGGPGSDTISAADGRVDQVDCGLGDNDTAYVDELDDPVEN